MNDNVTATSEGPIAPAASRTGSGVLDRVGWPVRIIGRFLNASEDAGSSVGGGL